MRTESDRLFGALFHGWVELLTLLLLLFVVLSLWGWANNRGYRPAERGPNTPWLLLLMCFALVALLRAVEASWPVAAVIGGALLVGGLVGRVVREMPLWLPAIALAVLLALGHVLSALVLAATGFLLLVLNTRNA
jgi:hypothetical protein